MAKDNKDHPPDKKNSKNKPITLSYSTQKLVEYIREITIEPYTSEHPKDKKSKKPKKE